MVKKGFGGGWCGIRPVFFGGWGFSGKFPQLEIPSFPRRRGFSPFGFCFFPMDSCCVAFLDSRVRGNDGVWGVVFFPMDSCCVVFLDSRLRGNDGGGACRCGAYDGGFEGLSLGIYHFFSRGGDFTLADGFGGGGVWVGADGLAEAAIFKDYLEV